MPGGVDCELKKIIGFDSAIAKAHAAGQFL